MCRLRRGAPPGSSPSWPRTEVPALLTTQLRAATVNGLAGFVLREDDGSLNTMAFEPDGSLIAAIYVVRNPDKLHHVRF